METTRQVPSHLQDQILKLPEYSQGVTRIRVTLDNGKSFGDVFVAWGEEIVKVGTSDEIPFDASKIVKVAKK